MATPKIPGDQQLFERVCYMLKLKVTKFQLPTPNGFGTIFKKPAGGIYPLSRIGLMVNFMISIIVHLPLRGCQLRRHFFNEYNYQ